MASLKKKIKLNDEQLTLQASNVSDIYHQLSVELFDNVVDRLLARGSESLDKAPYIWQLDKMSQIGLLNDDNVKLISEYSGIAEKQLRYVIEKEGYKVYKNTFEQISDDKSEIGLFSASVEQSLASYTSQTMYEIDNLINTTLPQSVQAMYKSIIEETVASVVVGVKTPQKALSDTIMKWHKKGFYGYTDSAGRRQRADSYARMIIKSTANRVSNEMRTRPALELGIDTFYYSKKATAREQCAPLQDRIVTTGIARTINGERVLSLLDFGYGQAGGCLGANCGHIITPFIVGVNDKPDLGNDVKNVTSKQAIENANIQAKQMALERSIRSNKENVHVAEKIGDTELIDKYKSKVRMEQGAMRELVKNNEFLHRDYSRERYYDDPVEKARKEIEMRERNG